ncbi:flap endonuclease-1 [Candidatus Woesearchaeota archaeon]|nr:flap endonuclease-1 [Candidatus Woesearchaeota archaeon]
MGINLGDIIPKREISLEALKNKKIAIDASQTLYQFLSSIRQSDGAPLKDSNNNITSHLMGISTRLPNLIEKGLKICFVFDGKPPVLKVHEQEQRESRKKLAEKKFKEAEKEEDEELMLKYAKQTTRLTREMSSEAKELIQAYGIPVIQSPSEAEAQCSFMCEQKDVDYVGSSDYDSFVYNAPRIIRNLTLSSRRRLPSGIYVNIHPEVIELKEVLKSLDITQDQLIAVSILVGTDYNSGGVKGIGPKTAIKLVKQYKSFDKLFKEVKADFDWKQVYAVFKSMPIMKNYQLKWNKPDREKIMKILVDKHEFNQERVENNIDKLLNYKKVQEQSSLNKWG